MAPNVFLDQEVDGDLMLRHCEQDREDLLCRLADMFGLESGILPSAIVEDVLVDVCGYSLLESSLSDKQLAFCDLVQQRVVVSLRISEAAAAKEPRTLALRRSTLAHELGHIRLHQDEVQSRSFLSCEGPGAGYSHPRRFQMENEAEFYAAVFLVPRDRLGEHKAVQAMMKAIREKRTWSSRYLWRAVYELARRFEVTPTLMVRSLSQYGLLKKTFSKQQGRHELELLQRL